MLGGGQEARASLLLKSFVSMLLQTLDIVQNHSLEHILSKGEMELGLREHELRKTLACLESLFGGRILGIINIQSEKMGPISNNRFKTDRAPVLYCFCLDFWLVSCTRENPSGLILYLGNVSGPTTFDSQNEVVWR